MEKVPEGKLLRIKTEFSDKITNVQITGDFFAHPEHSILAIEKKLHGLDLNFDDQILTNDINSLLEENNFDLLGIDAEAIVRVLRNSLTK